ncbi:MAG: TraB/VirB10 family protein [Pseudomonadota bacterium]
MNIRQRFDALPSKRRQGIIAAGVIGVVAVGGLFVYGMKTDRKAEEAKTADIGKVSITSDLLEETLKERVEGRVNELEGDNQEIKNLLGEIVDQLNRDKAESEKKLRGLKDGLDKTRALAERETEPAESETVESDDVDLSPRNELSRLGRVVAPTYPPAPGSPPGGAPVGAVPPAGLQSATYTPAEPPQPQVVGAISSGLIAQGFDAPEKKSPNQEDGIYLPPGFMNARLLTGVDALVSQGATGNPEPIMARVQAPAVLPNHVRANLQGCFVLGSATGSLAKERVEVRAVSLSCIDFQERAVIDVPIKGYFVDVDGKKGLSGRVVTRSGALLARSFIAGVLSGFGEAVQASAGTRAVSPLGEVRSFDAADVATAGLGGGVSQASEDLSELYLELARQAGPVVEVGAGKDVVLVIQEGANINIRRDVNVAQ